MPKEKLIDTYMQLLSDSLSPVTRTTRNKVMLFSTLGLIVALTGVTPDEPKLFGLEFPALTEKFIIASICTGILYFTVSFIIYSSVDRSKYVYLLDKFQNAKAIDLWSTYDLQKDDYEDMQEREFKSITGYDLQKAPKQSSQNISFRSVLDFYLPWIYGSVSLTITMIHLIGSYK